MSKLELESLFRKLRFDIGDGFGEKDLTKLVTKCNGQEST